MWHASAKVICQKKPVCLQVRSPFVCMCARAQIYVCMHVKTTREREIKVAKANEKREASNEKQAQTESGKMKLGVGQRDRAARL